MTGYSGYSMSNNAVESYNAGERPKSKWTKADILSELSQSGIPKEKLAVLKGLPVALLKTLCLRYTGWHHTSSYYNRTEFYMVDPDRVRSMSVRDLSSYSDRPVAVAKPPVERTAVFLEWYGTRSHPKAEERQAKGIVKGNWFYLSDGTKKSINARGFRFLD